jgi:hypothetical protein
MHLLIGSSQSLLLHVFAVPNSIAWNLSYNTSGMSRVKDPFSLTKLFNLLLEKFQHNNHVLNSNLKSETSTRMER